MRFWRFCYHSARYFLGLIFFTSGMGKLMPFPGLIGPVWLVERLAEYELGTYAQFIAASQICIGFLLFFERMAPIAAIMLVPMLLNIFMVTVSLGWRGTPVVLAGMFLMNLYLLLFNLGRYRFLLVYPSGRLQPAPLLRDSLSLDAAILGALALFLSAAFCHPIHSLTSFILLGLGFLAWIVPWFTPLRRRLRPPSILD